MANYNRIVLLGNLTRDPQYKVVPSTQMPIAEFGLAVNRKFSTKSGENREEVLFIDCAAFGKQADIINKYCRKGNPLLVEGRLKLDQWEDKQGGGKRSKHTVVVENFQLMGGRDGGAGAGGDSAGGYDAGDSYDTSRPPAPAPARAPQPQRPPPQAPAEAPFGDEQQFKEDDIPF